MKKTLYFLLAGLALMACDKQAPVASVPDADEISFAMGGEFVSVVGTRATPVTDANLSTLYVTATTGSSSETSVFTSAAFTKSGSSWTGGKFWPATNPSYHFYAANTQLTHTASGATVSPSNANTDIVVDYIATPNYKQTNTLALEHIFAQVGTVSMKAPAGYAVTNMKVSLQPVVGGTYNLKSDAWTTRGAAGSATYVLGTASAGVTVSTESSNATYTGNDNDLWLVPGDYVLTASYTIAKGAYTASVTKTCTVTLQQGKNNNIGPTVSGGQDLPNIPEPDDVAELTFSVTVTPWSDTHVDANF